jgi:hypothetical protein
MITDYLGSVSSAGPTVQVLPKMIGWLNSARVVKSQNHKAMMSKNRPRIRLGFQCVKASCSPILGTLDTLRKK